MGSKIDTFLVVCHFSFCPCIIRGQFFKLIFTSPNLDLYTSSYSKLLSKYSEIMLEHNSSKTSHEKETIMSAVIAY